MKKGHYGQYGGQYIAETLMTPLRELEAAYNEAKADPAFQAEFQDILRDYVGRESPLTYARRLSEHLGGARIVLKREDLNHTGAHKVNNTIGQALLARRMGKKRLIAETGAGMHGVATATVAALFGMPCEVYMGATDVARQAPNVARMQMLGATVHPIEEGSATLKDAMNEAIRDWITNCDDTFYVIGTVAGPHPYPTMVRDFQSVIGVEARRQMLEKYGKLPDQAIACVGGGSNAMGLFAGFIDDPGVKLVGVEAGGKGIATGEHAASICGGRGQRTDPRHVFRLRRPRLPRRGARARVPRGHRPRRVRADQRRRGDRRLRRALPFRGHHPRARVEPRPRRGHQARAEPSEGGNPARQPLRPRRQGHGQRPRLEAEESRANRNLKMEN